MSFLRFSVNYSFLGNISDKDFNRTVEGRTNFTYFSTRDQSALVLKITSPFLQENNTPIYRRFTTRSLTGRSRECLLMRSQLGARNICSTDETFESANCWTTHPLMESCLEGKPRSCRSVFNNTLASSDPRYRRLWRKMSRRLRYLALYFDNVFSKRMVQIGSCGLRLRLHFTCNISALIYHLVFLFHFFTEICILHQEWKSQIQLCWNAR